MSAATLLIEIGCEEIPARMIPAAAIELQRRLGTILQQAGLAHGDARAWGGSRRLAVRVERVQARQADRSEVITGPPEAVAFDDQGRPTAAAEGFARKQGVEAAALERIETERGVYAGLRREVRGADLGEVLAAALPTAVEGMPFPKAMRWGDGKPRWVRPVHWLVALHGERTLPLELFGVRAQAQSRGHRFLSRGPVPIDGPDAYLDALREAHVIADPDERRRRLDEKLRRVATEQGGTLVEDPGLLDEIADLVEWPEVVRGEFASEFLELPRELLITTLRYHQKCFAVQDGRGALMPIFLAVSNNAADRAGHIRRGNEWVVGGRLEDARFFWTEDRRTPLAERSGELQRVAFHAKAGSYADKARRMRSLAGAIAQQVGLVAGEIEAAARAAELCKLDLTTGTVGEFPELQGVVGGLLLAAEGESSGVADAVYQHYRPEGPDDPLPASDTGCVVSVADKLDSVTVLVGAGESPSGSRDPFGLRRAANGVLRIVIDREWPLSLNGLCGLVGAEVPEALPGFLAERLENFLRERGYGSNEIRSVLLSGGGDAWRAWSLPDVRARLDAIANVRGREDFRHLVELTKRVGNILRKNRELAAEATSHEEDFEDPEAAVGAVERTLRTLHPEMDARSRAHDYMGVVEGLAGLIAPVDTFFERALVIDPDNPRSTAHRLRLLHELQDVLTRYFDISQLSGQAETRRN